MKQEAKITYYESGALMTESNYKNGKLEGLEKDYYESGALQGERNYKNDKPVGLAKEYSESGVIQYIDTYKNGQRINRKVYDEIGKLIPDPAILN